jgi:dihydrodipicolinate synthase/N-acetylneuraminate lyase
VEACVQGATELRQAGVGLPVVIPGLLAGADCTDAEALKRLLAVGRRAGGPLGLYEAIAPFHRTLAPAALAALAAQGSYQLLKSTQGEPGPMQELVGAAPQRFPILEANTTDLQGVLKAGASGVLDFCAACFPELLDHLCRHWGNPDEARTLQRLCRWIGDTDALLLGSLAFPRGVKAVLVARGLSLLPLSRQAVSDLTPEQSEQTRDLVRAFQSLCRELGITPLV